MKPLRLVLRGPHGYHEESGPDLRQENDTYTCQHCGSITLVRKDTPQAWCKRCMGMVCERCAPAGACHPERNPNREEWLEAAENKRLLRKIIDAR